MMEALQRAAGRLGIALSAEQLALFQVYHDELVAWNERTNLTAISGEHDIQIKHFLDSLTCLPALPPDPSLRLLDLGSGAGFPGLPITIARPDVRLCLLESVGKKAEFLRHVVARLGLADVRILTMRAEDAGRLADEREQYDVVTARAVAELRVLVELALPFCRVGGVLIAQKRAGIDEEIANAARALEALGGALRTCVPIVLPGVEPRQLVIVDKVIPTPDRYPRRAGMPEKRPL
jgi:16S rRNA (guanine527-N7)-methyltransferase